MWFLSETHFIFWNWQLSFVPASRLQLWFVEYIPSGWLTSLAISQLTNLKTNQEWVFASDFLEGKRDSPDFNLGTRGFSNSCAKTRVKQESQSWIGTQRSHFQEEQIQRWPRMLGNALARVRDKVFICNVMRVNSWPAQWVWSYSKPSALSGFQILLPHPWASHQQCHTLLLPIFFWKSFENPD